MESRQLISTTTANKKFYCSLDNFIVYVLNTFNFERVVFSLSLGRLIVVVSEKSTFVIKFFDRVRQASVVLKRSHNSSCPTDFNFD